MCSGCGAGNRAGCSIPVPPPPPPLAVGEGMGRPTMIGRGRGGVDIKLLCTIICISYRDLETPHICEGNVNYYFIGMLKSPSFALAGFHEF